MKKRLILFLLASTLLALGACGYKVPVLPDESSQSIASESESTSAESISAESASAESISAESSQPEAEAKELKVHYIDVWQGDSAFIELPDGKCMLIDSGEYEYAGRVISLIDCLGYKKLDYIIVTHPHTDHMGGMQRVIENFKIGEIYMPEAVGDTGAFINLLEAIDNMGLSINIAKSGVEIPLSSGAKARFVAPVAIVEDLNNCSAMLYLSYGERSFLFTGDAEILEEETVTDNIDCDVLKVGHHGSYTSSGNAFLKKASPEIAVISCGKGNDYGHPHSDALKRLEKAGVKKIYRTDLLGNITVATNGKTLETVYGIKPSGYKWVLNIASKKLHAAECDSAIEMKESNKAYSKRSLKELQELGYTLCGSCKPQE